VSAAQTVASAALPEPMQEAKFTSLPSGFSTPAYNCGAAYALPGDAPGIALNQVPGPGLLNSVDVDALAAQIAAAGDRGFEVDPTPAPGPNHSPINNPALTNAYAAAPREGKPGYHQNPCGSPGAITGVHNGSSHAIAVDPVTNQVFVAVPNNALGVDVGNTVSGGAGAQMVGIWPGYQPGPNSISWFPTDPQYAPNAPGIKGDCTLAAPCVGQQATTAQNDSFTSLCSRGTDNLGNTGTDNNGCIFVLQDGP